MKQNLSQEKTRSFSEKLNDMANEGPLFKDTKFDKEHVPSDESREGMNQSPAAAFGAIDRMGGF